MVDVSSKEASYREATAQAIIEMNLQTVALIQDGEMPKGDVFTVAKIAGIQAAKRTSDLIPLCHPLPLSSVAVDFSWKENLLFVSSHCVVTGKTGVEMEALTAASVAALTIYDMCKAVDRSMTIREICLLTKKGGKSGSWTKK